MQYLPVFALFQLHVYLVLANSKFLWFSDILAFSPTGPSVDPLLEMPFYYSVFSIL